MDNDPFFLSSAPRNQKRKRNDEYDPFEDETPAEKRIRLAQNILKNVKSAADGEIDDRMISINLAKANNAVFQKRLADSFQHKSFTISKLFKGLRLPTTAVALSKDENFFYAASKDNSIIKYTLSSGKRAYLRGQRKGKQNKQVGKGHVGPVLALALTSDGKLLASGGKDRLIRIWDTSSNTLKKILKGHRDSVTGLAFRGDSRDLYSCSLDRMVKCWNCEEMMYIETLFGHQAGVNALACLTQETMVTCAGDKTARFWKVADESHLIFKTKERHIDCVCMPKSDMFVTGSQDGNLSLWSTTRKVPYFVVRGAHNRTFTDNEETKESEEENEEGNEEESEEEDEPNNGQSDTATQEQGVIKDVAWICSVASCPKSDVIASGSSTGGIRLWRIKPRKLEYITSIPVEGFVNSLVFAPSGKFLIAGVGQEHRLGRWTRNGEAKNSIVKIDLT